MQFEIHLHTHIHIYLYLGSTHQKCDLPQNRAKTTIYKVEKLLLCYLQRWYDIGGKTVFSFREGDFKRDADKWKEWWGQKKYSILYKCWKFKHKPIHSSVEQPLKMSSPITTIRLIGFLRPSRKTLWSTFPYFLQKRCCGHSLCSGKPFVWICSWAKMPPHLHPGACHSAYHSSNKPYCYRAEELFSGVYSI